MYQKKLGINSLVLVLALMLAGVSYAQIRTVAGNRLADPQSKTPIASRTPVVSKGQIVTRQVHEGSLVTLGGHVYPLAVAANDRGAVADSLAMNHMVMVLKRTPSQEQALTTLLDQLHDPKSPMYHQWLQPAEFGQYFGASDADIQALTTYLENYGFTVNEVSPGRQTLIFSGNAGQVRQAFHTEIHNYSVNGENHIANASDPSIPSTLAGMVSGFRSLNNFQAKPQRHEVGGFVKDKSTGAWKQETTAKAYATTNGGNTGSTANVTSLAGPLGDAYLVGPQDFYKIYNVNPLLTAGINGAGQGIAVIEQSDVNPADVTAFRAQFGLPAYPSTPNASQGGVKYFNGVSGYCADPGIQPGDEDEAILDVEWAGAVAPNATINVVSCASSSSSQGTDLALTYIVNHLSSTVSSMSYSYGACEAALGPASNAFYKNTYQQAVAQGQTVVVATGDGGSPGCDGFSAGGAATQGLGVNGLASTPYNIAAGGTDFSDTYQNQVSSYWSAANGAGFGSAQSYIPETAWNGSCGSPVLLAYANKLGLNAGASPEAWCNNAAFKAKYGDFVFLDGGGGGASSLYAKPSWQSAYGVPNDQKRDLPDVSLFASNFIYNHALAVCQSDKGYACDASNSAAVQTMAAGGTSFVAPQVAGLIALVNQKTNARQGQANYTLYALASTEYGSTSAPKTSQMKTCNGSKGSSVGGSCMFYDVNAVPKPGGGTVADSISQPCAKNSPNCVASVKKDAFGLLSSSTTSQVAAYPVGNGYDLATGLGSMNFANLVNGWTVSSTPAPATSSATTTTLTAAPTTIPFGGQTTLTATVTNSTFSSPTGTVQFYVGGVAGRLLGTATLVVGRAPTSTATLGVAGSALNPGANDLVAVFSGDGANDSASTSASVTVNVGLTPLASRTTTTSLVVSDSNLLTFTTAKATVKQYTILSGAVTASTGTATGTVTLKLNGTTTLATATLTGTATYSATIDTTGLALGSSVNSITAVYAGTTGTNNYLTSTSPAKLVSVVNTISNFGSLNVGTAATPTKKYKVTFLAALTVGAVSDLTQGASALDYIDGGTTPNTKCTTTSYAVNASCDISLGFLPTLPGLRLGSAVIYDGSNVPAVTVQAIGTGLGPQLSFGFAAPTSITSTTTTAFNGPSAVAVDGTGNLFIADAFNNRIVEQPASGAQRNVGTGFAYPIGMAVDGAGNLYVSDANFGVSKVPNQRGTLNSTNQTKLTITGGVGFPAELSFDTAGNLYIADSMNNRIVKLSRVNGDLDAAHPTYIGTGLTYPEGVVVDGSGNIFISDTGFPADPGNDLFGRIVEIPAANPSTQITLGVQVNSPSYLGVDASGTLYIADTDDSLVLQVPPGAGSSTAVNLTVNAAQPQYWGGLALDMKGNLWAPDLLNNQVVKVTQYAPSMNFGTNLFTGTYGPMTVPVYNYGNANLNIYGFNPPQYFYQSGGSCLAGTLVAAGSNCTMSIIFKTTNWFTGTLNPLPFDIQDNEGNATSASPHADTILVTGYAIF